MARMRRGGKAKKIRKLMKRLVQARGENRDTTELQRDIEILKAAPKISKRKRRGRKLQKNQTCETPERNEIRKSEFEAEEQLWDRDFREALNKTLENDTAKEYDPWSPVHRSKEGLDDETNPFVIALRQYELARNFYDPFTPPRVFTDEEMDRMYGESNLVDAPEADDDDFLKMKTQCTKPLDPDDDEDEEDDDYNNNNANNSLKEMTQIATD